MNPYNFNSSDLYSVYKDGKEYFEGYFVNIDQYGICLFLDADGVNCHHYVNLNSSYSFSMPNQRTIETILNAAAFQANEEMKKTRVSFGPQATIDMMDTIYPYGF